MCLSKNRLKDSVIPNEVDSSVIKEEEVTIHDTIIVLV